ncbi:MlaD family protein [Bdellovibrio sp. BCCA]|uniref:MlaD family protein n=1 Tax=Bdellovibrio sp. BCCA TaxID=3136281 RepID=UPI0030F12FFA
MKNLKDTWYLWLFPLFAVMLAGWLFWNYYRHRGPTITIYFNEGTRIKPGKTEVRFRGVQIGLVKDVTITSDLKKIEVIADLNRDAKSFAQNGAKFWIESPRISFEEVRGLDTLVEGSYIGALPGTGDLQREFTGREAADLKYPLDETAGFKLETKNAESIGEGDPVFYRGVNVGSVAKVTFSKTGQTVFVNIRVPWVHAKLIRENTVFWRKSGFQGKLGLFKSEVKLSSLEALLKGGIEFATPEPAAQKAKHAQTFQLQANAPKDWEKWNPDLD